MVLLAAALSSKAAWPAVSFSLKNNMIPFNSDNNIVQENYILFTDHTTDKLKTGIEKNRLTYYLELIFTGAYLEFIFTGVYFHNIAQKELAL